MTALQVPTQLRDPTARCARVVANRCPRKQRAQGMPGTRCTRSPRAMVVSTRRSHRSTGTLGISLRNGFNGLCRPIPGGEFTSELNRAEESDRRMTSDGLVEPPDVIENLCTSLGPIDFTRGRSEER